MLRAESSSFQQDSVEVLKHMWLHLQWLQSAGPTGVCEKEDFSGEEDPWENYAQSPYYHYPY